MELASMCMDMRQGLMLRLPLEGGPFAQDMRLLSAMRQAHRVWMINEWMPANNVNPDDDDYEFMSNLMELIRAQDGTA